MGTFVFASDRIEAKGYDHHARLKLRTGGSTGKISRASCHVLGGGGKDGYYWDLTGKSEKSEKGKSQGIRLPVRYRYRSPIVFEFHISNKRKADAYAVLWLNTLIDNEELDIDLPILRTGAPQRLFQNFLTAETLAQAQSGEGVPGLKDLQEVGRLKFKGMFKAGMDESHEAFVSDNDSRETYETFESCLSEGVRTRQVEKELPERISALHDKSLMAGRDLLKDGSEEEKQKWLSKSGTDWSGAFGVDPAEYAEKKSRRSRKSDAANQHDPGRPSSDDDTAEDDDDDLGIQDGSNMNGSESRRSMDSGWTAGSDDTAEAFGPRSQKDINRQNKRSVQRKHRGLMQWTPVRSIKFFKDEGVLGVKKLKGKLTGNLDGRQPGVDTETGQ